jgi:hypothetical protein
VVGRVWRPLCAAPGCRRSLAIFLEAHPRSPKVAAWSVASRKYAAGSQADILNHDRYAVRVKTESMYSLATVTKMADKQLTKTRYAY